MTTSQPPSADVVFDTLFAYQRSAALKAAHDLDLFSVIDDGANTASAAATRCGASERGIRILCDYLGSRTTSTISLAPCSAAAWPPRAAFEVEFGAGYDVVVSGVGNGCDETGGRVVILEMVPNPDRVTPVVAGPVQPYDAGRDACVIEVVQEVYSAQPDGARVHRMTHVRVPRADPSPRECWTRRNC
jgi:hypothetical protein